MPRSQKAPSAKRCIKTCDNRKSHGTRARPVRKHRAPKGALRPRPRRNRLTNNPTSESIERQRCIKTDNAQDIVAKHILVRKHRAPKGALRLTDLHARTRQSLNRQQAPSAKRCIKTLLTIPRLWVYVVGQKAPSAKRCIKTSPRSPRDCKSWSESTERQKVH